jgi:hypothetical protein
MAKKHDAHISKTDDNHWKVTQNSEKLSTHATQANAIEGAKSAAKKDSVDFADTRARRKDQEQGLLRRRPEPAARY